MRRIVMREEGRPEGAFTDDITPHIEVQLVGDVALAVDTGCGAGEDLTVLVTTDENDAALGPPLAFDAGDGQPVTLDVIAVAVFEEFIAKSLLARLLFFLHLFVSIDLPREERGSVTFFSVRLVRPGVSQASW